MLAILNNEGVSFHSTYGAELVCALALAAGTPTPAAAAHTLAAATIALLAFATVALAAAAVIITAAAAITRAATAVTLAAAAAALRPGQTGPGYSSQSMRVPRFRLW